MKRKGMGPMIVVFGAMALLVCAVLINYYFFRQDFEHWRANGDPSGQSGQIDGARLFNRVKGRGSPLIVLESGLGSSYISWDALQTDLAQYGTVLAYDRGDYGFSVTENYPRTNATLSRELAQLLASEKLDGPVVLVGHSFGANQVVHHALNLPMPILGIVLIDPGFFDSGNTVADLLKDERLGESARRYVQSVIGHGDLFALQFAGTSGLMFRLYMLQGGGPADPNYTAIMNSSSPGYYRALRSESDNDCSTFTAEEKQRLAQIPLVLITSNPVAIRQEVAQTGLNLVEAAAIADSYQKAKEGYLSLSHQSQLVVAKTGAHGVHLVEPGLILAAVSSIIDGH